MNKSILGPGPNWTKVCVATSVSLGGGARRDTVVISIRYDPGGTPNSPGRSCTLSLQGPRLLKKSCVTGGDLGVASDPSHSSSWRDIILLRKQKSGNR